MEYKDDPQSLLERIDIFGIGINIRFSKKAEHKTKIGGLFTIIIAGLMIYQIKIVHENFIDSSNPTVIFEQTFTAQPERYYLKPNIFTLAFGLQDPSSNHFIDSQVYQLTLYYKQSIRVLNQSTSKYERKSTSRIVQVEPCTIHHFQETQGASYFLELEYQNLYCLSLQETDLYIEGQFDSTNYSTLELVVEECTSQNCKSPDERSSKLNQGRLAIYFVDYSVIPTNKDKPFQPLGRQVFWTSGPAFTKALKLNFRNTYIKSDLGFVGQDLHTEKILTYSSDRDQTTPRLQNIMYDCFIALEKNIDNNYKRSYPKFDKALAQIGGTFNILFALGAFFCKPLSQLELNRKLINRIFSFIGKDNRDIDMKKNQQLHDKITKTFQKQTLSNDEALSGVMKKNVTSSKDNQNNISDILSTLQDNQPTENQTEFQMLNSKRNQTQTRIRRVQSSLITQQRKTISVGLASKEIDLTEKNPTEPEGLKDKLKNIQKEKDKKSEDLAKFFQVQNSSIIFRAWEYFVSIFKLSDLCRNSKQRLIQKGIQKLYNHIDIFYLIQKLLEVEKLKHLLLNENQIKLFEFIPKPVLQIEDKKTVSISDKVDILYEDERSLFDKAFEAQKAFHNMMQNQKKISKLDARILEMLDPQFKLLLEDLELNQTICTPVNNNTHHFNLIKINLQNNEIPEERSNQPYNDQANDDQINVTIQKTDEKQPYEFLQDTYQIENEIAHKVYSSATKTNEIHKMDEL